MTERTRTFVGTLPVNPAYDAWQQAHDEYCLLAAEEVCEHPNPYPETVQVLVHLFEDATKIGSTVVDAVVHKGMEVAVHNGEPGRMSRWTPPATMTEETSDWTGGGVV